LKSPATTQEQLVAEELTPLENNDELERRMRRLSVEPRRQLEEQLERLRKLSGLEPLKTTSPEPEKVENPQEPTGNRSIAVEIAMLGCVVFACFYLRRMAKDTKNVPPTSDEL
jgi:hypothetical protein